MPIIVPSLTHDPAPTAVITSAWGDAVNAGFTYYETGRPRCRAVRTNNSLAAPDQTDILVTLPAEVGTDVGGMHSTATNTDRLTIPAGESGWYLALGWAEITSTSSQGDNALQLRRNNATSPLLDKSGSGSDALFSRALSVSAIYPMDAGDWFGLVFRHSRGAGTHNINDAGLAAIWLCSL